MAVLVCGTVEAATIRAAFVDGVVEIKSSVREANNVWPWELARLKESKKLKNGLEEEVIVSNACGFGEGIYEGCMTTAKSKCPQRVRARFLKGEWCRIQEYVFDDPAILMLREWNRRFYIVDSVPLYSDDNSNHFVVSGEFIRTWSLTSVAEDVSRRVCFERAYLSESQQERLLSDDNAIGSEKKICFKLGVSAENVLKQFSNKSLQAGRAEDAAAAE
jgi:hypothetical protein